MRKSGLSRAGSSLLGTRGGAANGGASRNPFALPSEEEFGQIREIEREEKLREREELGRKKVWEKLPSSHRAGRIKRLTEADVPVRDETAREQIARTQRLVASATQAMGAGGRRTGDRESIGAFLSKKREMFLVQMSLDTKREEIQKLERKAQLKEEALKKSEVMLEEDAIRFDAFLKENDKEAFQALKQAEAETKKKQEALQRIKRLRHTINALSTETAKIRDSLKSCRRYKSFLDSLTDESWLQERRREKRQRQEERRQARLVERRAAWEQVRQRKETDVKRYARTERQRALRDGEQPPTFDIPEMVLSEIPPMPGDADEPLTSSGEDLPMHFVRPGQLLEKFARKEAENLSLIQQAQGTEQQLEELRAQHREMKGMAETQQVAQQSSLKSLKTQIVSEARRGDALARRAAVSSGGAAQARLLNRLGRKIEQVHDTCVGAQASKPTRIGMLTRLEGELESLLEQIEAIPKAYVEKQEDDLERSRRESRVKERKLEAVRQQRQRMERSVMRSEAPVQKRTTKPVMWRSRPPVKKKKEEKPDPARMQELEDLKFLT